jgi:imidazolonepropionase-like amidohydrolase
MRGLLLTAALAALSTPVAAQDIAVTNARLMTAGPAGEIASGTVVVRGGRITAVGPNAPVPAGMRTIDAGGRIVTPGLVSTNSTLSVSEIEQYGALNDVSSASPAITAAFDIQYGVNPASAVIPVARLGGITRAIITPVPSGGNENGEGHAHDMAGPASGGFGENNQSLFGGTAAAIHLGAHTTDIVVKPNIAMVAAMGDEGASLVGGSRGAVVATLKATLDAVRSYQRNPGAFDRGETRDFGLSRADLEALIPVVQGRMPLVVSVSRASDIRNILKVARDERIRIIIEAGEEAHLVARELAAANVPVILNPTADLPSRFETQGVSLENAARLQRAGVLVAIAGDRTGHYARQTRYNAGIAVTNGLPMAEALKAITINPARIYGVDDRFGSLEVGKDGDFVVWDGDPFEPLTQPTAVVIQGRSQPMRSRQLDLRDRYMGADPTMPRAYPR